MPTRRRPLLENPSRPTLPQGMTSSTRQRRQSVTRRGQRSIDSDRSKGMLPNPRTDLRKALGLHPRTQSIGGSARMTRPDRTRTLGQMVPKDRREEAGSPNNIKVKVPTKEETAKPRTAVPTLTHRRPETGPQLLGRGPSRSASNPTEINLRQGELTEIPKTPTTKHTSERPRSDEPPQHDRPDEPSRTQHPAPGWQGTLEKDRRPDKHLQFCVCQQLKLHIWPSFQFSQRPTLELHCDHAR